MKLSALIILASFYFLFLMSINTVSANAQAGQLWETIVGDPQEEAPPVYDDEGNEVGGGDGGVDVNLGPGEFLPPFRCNLSYTGLSYADHPGDSGTSYAVDFNRGNYDDDEGDPVRAAAAGVVIWEDRPSYGVIALKHGTSGYETWYGHMQNIIVKYGDRVKTGQKIGEIGRRHPTIPISPHLHTYHRKDKSLIRVAYYNKPYPVSLPWISPGMYNCGSVAAMCSNVKVTGPCP